jgi:uncharacterized membrane protein
MNEYDKEVDVVEENVGTPMGEEEVVQTISDDDKLWAALSWLPWVGWILAIIALLIEPQKDRAFVRYHAVQALVANAILTIISIVLGITVILSCIAPFLWVVLLYPAVKAYQGEWVEIPFVTDFSKNQGWI